MPIKTELPSEETSEEESSDSDEEPTTKTPATVISTPQLKTFSVGIKQTPVVAAKTPLKSSQPADESSEEESTDSSEEPSVKKPATVHLSQPKTPSGGAKQASVLAKTQSPAKTTPLADESSEESDSEEESAAKALLLGSVRRCTNTLKPATVHLSQPKTPSGGAKQASVLAKTQSPAKTTPLADDESSEESDSEEESAAKKPTTAVQSSQLKTPSGGAKQTTLKATLKTPLKTAQQDSESSEESDTDEETVAKKPATALQSTQPKSPSGDPKQTAMMAKSKTAEPNSESSDESDSDEEAAAKRSKSTAPVKVPKKTPAVVGKKVTKPAAADATDSSDSDDEEKAQPKPSAVSRGLKAKQSASTALKPDESSEESESESDEEPVKPAEVKTLETQKEKLSASQPKITAQPAAIVSKGKSLVSSKMTAFSQAMADSSESTESSDNEDLPPAQVPRISVKATPPAANVTVQPAAVAKHKAGGPTKSVPGTKLAKVDQGTPDGSESSDGEEQPDAQKLELSVEAKQKKKPMSAPLLTSTPYESTVSKGKAAVPASTHLVAKETDISESSDTESDEEETKQVVTPTPSFVKSKSGRITDTLAKTSTSSNPAIAKTTTPFKVPSTLKKDPVENSSESSDSESSEETAVKVNTPVPTAVKAAQPKVSEKLKTPNVTNPVPGKPNASSQQKPKQVDTDSSSESSDSEAEPVVKTAVQKVTTPGPTAKKMKQENQSDKVVRTPLAPKLLPSKPTGISVAKTPLQAGEESSSESSSSEEDTAEKPPPATPKPAAQPSVGKTTTQSPAVLQKKQESSSEESDSDEEEPVKKPTAATPKPAAQPTVRKTTTQSPAVLHKKQESSSEESDSDEKEPVKKLTSSFGKTQKKPEPAASLTKLKSPAKSTVVTKSNVSSDTASSDSEEDRPVQDKGAAPGNLASSNKSVERSVGKMSSADVKKIRPAVPSTPSGGSKPKDSQTLLKAFFPVVTTPKKRKKNSKTTNKLDSVAGKSKKKEAKNKVQPDIVPVLPMALPEQSPSAVALLESEEETVLALLEGRSPKKAKKNKISKKAAESAVFDFATPLVQNNDVPLKSPLPQPFLSSTWVPESPTSGDDKSVQPTTELLSLSDKKVKSSKKRKIFQDLEKQTQKPAKKAKKDEKEKKIQKGMVEEANVTAKPKSDKKKSEKDRSNKKTKTKEKMENKEGKKKAESIAAAVVESADSGIGLSKPKKKRKT
ncbi:nucleolar protein dao-5-like isoform X3 [Rana temporaria]|uniref:nucleolar protein dao-5-like isoform X3 n=1 Tax=Rana temporaria TaxID=8407 RepID=UPI001AAC4C08|nr:nucleolar protein dao-5-like isoform X3 [Rana temporaria]